MPDNLKDILSHLSTEIDQETLLQYLNGSLPEDKKHAVEQKLLQDGFDNDAVEGLEQIRDKQQIQYMVEKLNRDLKKHTQLNKERVKKLKISFQSTTLYIAILILLLLIIISYIIIRRLAQ
jgi:hypothetical protein